MPLARHDKKISKKLELVSVSTHMPLARHDIVPTTYTLGITVSTHMPLARHDADCGRSQKGTCGFLLTCLLRGMTGVTLESVSVEKVSTHMPLARHDSV